MKAATVFTIAAFAAAHVAALPNLQAKKGEAKAQPSPLIDEYTTCETFCGIEGDPCFDKRDVEPPAVIRDEHENWFGYCGIPGSPCVISRSAGRAVTANATGIGYCGTPGSPCGGLKRAANAIAHALAGAESHQSSRTGLCGADGTPCQDANKHILNIAHIAGEASRRILASEAATAAESRKHRAVFKRDANAVFGELDLEHHGWDGFCGLPGNFCMTKRDAEAEHLSFGSADNRWNSFCGLMGSPCVDRRHSDPKRQIGNYLGYCGGPGTSCAGHRAANAEIWKSMVPPCGGPSDPCIAARDVVPNDKPSRRDNVCGVADGSCIGESETAAMVSSIKQKKPGQLKKECFQPGGECHTLLQVHKAFLEVKRDESHISQIRDPKQRLAYCGTDFADCLAPTYSTVAAFAAGDPSAKQVERDCYSNDGPCMIALRDLDELERSINAAVVSLNEEE